MSSQALSFHDVSENVHSFSGPNSHFSIPYDPQAYGSSAPTHNMKQQPPSNPMFQPGSIPTLSRKFVARRISEGETGRLKEELKCQACGKGYKHVSSLAKHLWEHTPEWNMTSKLLISKHQQVQLLEAASILVSMNEEDEDANSTADSTTTNDSNVNSYTPGPCEDMSPSPPPQTTGNTAIGLTNNKTSSDRGISGSPTTHNAHNLHNAHNALGIPMGSSNWSVSKTSSSQPFHRRSSRSSISSPASSLLAIKSPVTDSLFTDALYGTSMSSSLSTVRIMHDDYELLASPNRARRMSHLRHTNDDTGDLSLSEDNKTFPDFIRHDPDSPSVFGDMDE